MASVLDPPDLHELAARSRRARPGPRLFRRARGRLPGNGRLPDRAGGRTGRHRGRGSAAAPGATATPAPSPPPPRSTSMIDLPRRPGGAHVRDVRHARRCARGAGMLAAARRAVRMTPLVAVQPQPPEQRIDPDRRQRREPEREQRAVTAAVAPLGERQTRRCSSRRTWSPASPAAAARRGSTARGGSGWSAASPAVAVAPSRSSCSCPLIEIISLSIAPSCCARSSTTGSSAGGRSRSCSSRRNTARMLEEQAVELDHAPADRDQPAG